jgi:putative DNA primase/helicase
MRLFAAGLPMNKAALRKASAVEKIQLVAIQALSAAPLLLQEWLPEGAINGSEWVARNIVRGDRHPGSFGVSLTSGRWNDFADDQAHGSDLVSLLAYLRCCRQMDAAKEIDQRLALGLLGGGSATPCPMRQRKIDAARHAAEQHHKENAEQLKQQRQAAVRQANQLWAMARRADRLHPYLVTKGLGPLKLRQLSRGRLLVPLCLDGHLVNLQIIDSQGEKRFLCGGQVAGCYSPIGTILEGCRLYVCEGWATGATLHLHTGCPVVCAMNAGNLRAVAIAMRARYGRRVEIVIAGDDDRQTKNNPGRWAANRAALAADATVVFPEWPVHAPHSLSDFNDLHLWRSQHGNLHRERA